MNTPYDVDHRNIQMMLVRLLIAQISWEDRKRIMEAMHAVEKHYCSMAEEFRNYKPDSGQAGQPLKSPV